jgi:hypothetical protein
MSETQATKTRTDVRRFYTDQGNYEVSEHVGGAVVGTNLISDLPGHVQAFCTMEGYISLRIQGLTHAQIVAKEGFPKRIAPGVKAATAPRPLTVWQRAIVVVRTEELVAARKAVTGMKVPAAERGELAEQATAWTRARSKAQLQRLKTSAKVIAAYGDITGKRDSLDYLLAVVEAPASAAPPLEEAAD